jgi:hypothetical protein
MGRLREVEDEFRSNKNQYSSFDRGRRGSGRGRSTGRGSGRSAWSTADLADAASALGAAPDEHLDTQNFEDLEPREQEHPVEAAGSSDGAAGDGRPVPRGTVSTGDGLSSDDEADSSDEEAEDSLPYNSAAVAEAFFQCVPGAAEVLTRLHAAAHGVLQCTVHDAAKSTPCPTCNQQGDPVGLEPCTVTVVTWDQPVQVQVPLITCRACMRPYTVQPTQLGCLPDTTVSWDLLRKRDGHTVLWWQASLLQQYTGLQYYNRHLGMDRFCAALMANWRENGCADPGLTLTQLRQRLSPATQRYRFLCGLVEDLPEQLPGWPTGALNGCACCGDAAMHSSRNNQPSASQQALAGSDRVGAPHAAAPAAEHATTGGLGDGLAGAAAEAAAGAAGAPPGDSGAGSSTGGSAGIEWRPMLEATEPAGPGPSSLHSAHFDCVFKLNQFKRACRSLKYSINYRQLARRRYTLGNTYVRGFEPPKGAVDIGRNTDCSTFTADRVLAKEEAGVRRGHELHEMGYDRAHAYKAHAMGCVLFTLLRVWGFRARA